MRLAEKVRDYLHAGRLIQLTDDLPSFFDELVDVAFPSKDGQTKRHISRDVLLRFASMPQLRKESDAMKIAGLNALLSKSPSYKQDDFVNTGDCCLFMTGLFPSFIGRRLPGKSYFISYGRGCYYAALHMSGFAEHKEVLANLADNFRDYMSTLNEVSHATFK